MKRLLLVNTNLEKYPYPIPPLGICLLASYLKPWYEVNVYDGVFDEGRTLVDLVQAYDPDYIGFSIRNIDDVVADKTIFYMDRIISDFIRPVQQISKAPIIVGGCGFSVFPDEIMELTGADYGVVGEGEEVFLSLLRCLDKGKPAVLLPRVLMKDNVGRIAASHKRYLPYHSIPFSEMDRHIDFMPYRQRGVFSIQTKRGCALKCIYCNYPGIEGKKYRLRDPHDIAREIEEAMDRLGKVTFEFVDSTFNEPAGHAEDICRAIIQRKIHPQLRTMGINPRNTSSELFDLMMHAGFRQIDVTPDSAAPTVIKNLKKRFTLEDITRVALLTRMYDLPTMWFFLFGGPGETVETVAQTRNFIGLYINEEDMVLMHAGLRIYPNTPLEKIALKEGVIQSGESLFYPSPYYFSADTPKKRLDKMLKEIRDTFHNCLPAAESSPSPEMIQKALNMRKEKGLTEPMFRTLLRIRKDEGRRTKDEGRRT
ncbi:MAG: radical SAM protein [Bacteroidales bacterium]|nr:radical SAM protein [Bacteroidales bacterium]